MLQAFLNNKTKKAVNNNFINYFLSKKRQVQFCCRPVEGVHVSKGCTVINLCPPHLQCQHVVPKRFLDKEGERISHHLTLFLKNMNT